MECLGPYFERLLIKLNQDTFSTIIEHTPLVSIDLVVICQNEKILLGQRLSRPAKGDWFVLLGRILKNESLSSAFKRLTLNEIGTLYQIEDAINKLFLVK